MGLFKTGSPVVDKAVDSLNEIRWEKGYVSPCQRYPEVWDDYETADVAESGCMGCSVFTACQTVRLSLSKKNPEISGVIAGEFINGGEG